MALAFRNGAFKVRSAFNCGGQLLPAKETLDNLKKAVRGLNESTHGLVIDFAGLSQAIKINGGKLPGVNVIP